MSWLQSVVITFHVEGSTQAPREAGLGHLNGSLLLKPSLTAAAPGPWQRPAPALWLAESSWNSKCPGLWPSILPAPYLFLRDSLTRANMLTEPCPHHPPRGCGGHAQDPPASHVDTQLQHIPWPAHKDRAPADSSSSRAGTCWPASPDGPALHPREAPSHMTGSPNWRLEIHNLGVG